MKKNTNTKIKNNFKKCGAITCINNIDGLCNNENCMLHEKMLIQED